MNSSQVEHLDKEAMIKVLNEGKSKGVVDDFVFIGHELFRLNART